MRTMRKMTANPAREMMMPGGTIGRGRANGLMFTNPVNINVYLAGRDSTGFRTWRAADCGACGYGRDPIWSKCEKRWNLVATFVRMTRPAMLATRESRPGPTRQDRCERLLPRPRGPVEVHLFAGEFPRLWVPREVDEHHQSDRLSGRRHAGPFGLVRADHLGDFEHPLRADHDVLQVELHVGECPEERRVKRPRPVVALPALAGRDDLVDAVFAQRVDQPLQIASVLGDRVFDPQPPDAL